MNDKSPTCQYCLADSRYTSIGNDRESRCPVCGADYSGPRRSTEFNALVKAGLVAEDE